MLNTTIHNRCKNASLKLRQKREELISNFVKGKASDFLHLHARILDDYFRQSFERSIIGPQIGINKNPYAIFALGGYGREEQCIHSDVDLLFLFRKFVPDEAEELIREIIYPLWDIGLEVGHATRSLKECISLAGKDFEVLTPLLDARFVCGMSPLYSKLMEQVWKKIISRRSRKIIDWLLEKNRERHLYFGDSAYLLEPNLKEGQGGLRDYHTMLWIGRIKFNIRQPRDLEYNGYLSHEEFKRLTEALSFIWNVRSHLHHLTGRKCDQLHFEHQIKISNVLNFKKSNGQEPVECFLGELHGHMEFIKQQFQMLIYESGIIKRSKRKKKSIKPRKINGLETVGDMLNFTSSKKILHSPDLLVKIFEESARLKIPLSAEAKRLVKEFSYLVDDDLRTSASVVKSFEKILVAPTQAFDVLNEMLSTGFLLKFIPEIKDIVNRIQYDAYHIYPVARHSLRTVRTIKDFDIIEDGTKEQLYRKLFKELKSRKLLLWAALLHDIGKGVPGKDHSQVGTGIVRNILTAKGLKSKDIDTVLFLVQEHQLLKKTATRRDIHDEETAISCARVIKDIERLKMLYLLTVADSMSTGPKAWNDWTSTLLMDFFLKVLNILERGELATREAVQVVEKKKEEVVYSTSKPDVRKDLEALFNVMSPRYLLYTSAQDILKHINLYNSLASDDFVWNVTRNSDSNTRTVIICAKDRPGLFSKIAGTFTLNSIDILDAQVSTWKNNIALDIFKVKPPLDQIFENEKWVKAEKNLRSVLSGTLDLGAALNEMIPAFRSFKSHAPEKPHQIIIDNKSSSFFTIIEVFSYNFPGLLFSITDALFRCRLDVWVAKIATKIDQVVDVFYVRDFDGQKVDAPDQMAAIKEAIAEVLPR